MVLADTLVEARRWLRTPNAHRATYAIFAEAIATLAAALQDSTWQRVLLLAPSDAACTAAGLVSGAAWAAQDPAGVLSLFVVLPDEWPNVTPGYRSLPTLNQGFRATLLATKAGFIVPGGGCENGVCSPLVEVPKPLSCGVAALLLRDALLDPTAMPALTVAGALDSAAPATLAFQRWLADSGLLAALAGQGDFTVFAPTDAALARLAEYLELSVPALLAGPLAALQGYYVVPGALSPCDRATASDGFPLSLTYDAWGNLTFVNAAAIVQQPYRTDNGSLYLLDNVLLHGVSGPQPQQVTARRGPGSCGGLARDAGQTALPAAA